MDPVSCGFFRGGWPAGGFCVLLPGAGFEADEGGEAGLAEPAGLEAAGFAVVVGLPELTALFAVSLLTAAGLAGAAVATAAMCGPTCVLAFLVARTWDRFKEARWRIAIQVGLVPVSLGLIAASAFVLARSADHNIYAAAITAITAIIGFASRINPLWIFAVGGVLGLSGWL